MTHLGMDQRPSISITSRAVQLQGSTSESNQAFDFLINRLAPLLVALEKAREIAHLYQFDPTTPDGFAIREIRAIDNLYELMKGRTVPYPESCSGLTLTLTREGAQKFVEDFSTMSGSDTITCQSDYMTDLFGEPVRVDGVTNVFTNMRLTTEIVAIRAELGDPTRTDIQVEFDTTLGTSITMRGPARGSSLPACPQVSVPTSVVALMPGESGVQQGHSSRQ
jgi:hypothetical protein